MGYWDNQGAPATKATWSNPKTVPDSQKQNGGWYYNPATGNVDRWWSGSKPSGGGGGGGQQQQQQQQQDPAQAARDEARRIAEERDRKYREQANIWNEFMSSPTYFDEMLVRRMKQDYYNNYYKTLLNEFVNPLQERMSQSLNDEKRILAELMRQKEVGTEEREESLSQNLEAARGGFAGAGVYGGGGARRALAQQKISGQRELSDFLSRNEAQSKDIAEKEAFNRRMYQGEIEQKGAEFDREKAGDIETDVAKAKEQATKAQASRAYNAISGKFGDFIINVPEWLRY